MGTGTHIEKSDESARSMSSSSREKASVLLLLMACVIAMMLPSLPKTGMHSIDLVRCSHFWSIDGSKRSSSYLLRRRSHSRERGGRVSARAAETGGGTIWTAGGVFEPRDGRYASVRLTVSPVCAT